MGNTSARWWPAWSSPPMISSGVAVRPSGSLWPMCVWASNHATSPSSSAPERRIGSRRGSKLLPTTGTEREASERAPRGRTGAICENRAMAGSDRLSALDTAFLQLESGGAHMHVAAVFVFAGDAPPYEELVAAIARRLHVVPRYRQKLAHVPLGQGRPEWVDDPHFNPRYHLRHSALPAPGGDAQLERLAGRLFALPLDRTKPLWEMNLVEGLAPGVHGEPRFAIVSKTHHALVDGVSGVDITSVLFDRTPEPPDLGPQPQEAWVARPEPTGPQLLARALVERATVPGEGVRALSDATRAPRRALRGVVER